MLAKGVVHDTWPQALIAREAEFPTGIMLEQHAIAIPHCEAIHAKSSAIYLLRPTNKVHFQQADDDNDVAVSLVIALIQCEGDDIPALGILPLGTANDFAT
ncbi:PTS galactitol transporter subunit IIA, partial [Enterobacter hormaechei subsp. steigerwaltii]|nr:PTS galactitol transporter subunit IIA [Enterobacter hormaechei subsp. steigerwaltii]